jgi:hypothetical protein
MTRIERRWTTVTTIVALSTKVKANAICGVGTWGHAIHTVSLIGKAVWKLRLALMVFS